MSCIHCGTYTDPGQSTCPNCNQNPRVIVLPPEENKNFQGITIDQTSDNADYNQPQTQHSNPNVYARHFKFNAKGNLLLKILLGVIFLLILLIALPLALILLALFIFNWIFLRRAAK
jgi:hypothetical protein